MTNTALTAVSNETGQGLQALAEKILAPETVRLSTLHPHEAQTLLAVCERQERRPSATESLDLVEILLGSYPNLKANNPDIYTAALAKVFESFPQRYGREVVEELPMECKFLPTVQEVNQALKAKEDRRKEIAIRSRQIIALHEKEEAERIEREKWKNIDTEKRAKHVQKLLKNFQQDHTI